MTALSLSLYSAEKGSVKEAGTAGTMIFSFFSPFIIKGDIHFWFNIFSVAVFTVILAAYIKNGTAFKSRILRIESDEIDGFYKFKQRTDAGPLPWFKKRRIKINAIGFFFKRTKYNPSDEKCLEWKKMDFLEMPAVEDYSITGIEYMEKAMPLLCNPYDGKKICDAIEIAYNDSRTIVDEAAIETIDPEESKFDCHDSLQSYNAIDARDAVLEKIDDLEEEFIEEQLDYNAAINQDADPIYSSKSNQNFEHVDQIIYHIPLDFLKSSTPIDPESQRAETQKNSILLVNTLMDFGIESKVINVNRGPVVTQYELQIAPGIKVNRIVSLSDDISMALAASSVRIVAPIPGKSAVGVEIPNTRREIVMLGDIIKSDEYRGKKGTLTVALGKDILGIPIRLDIKTLPHLLIAGATGSGKSVCVNSIITSLIYNYDQKYLKFILIDPKMVELQIYNGLPHLLSPVITEPHRVPYVLKWALNEMERRYRLLSKINCRDIERFNEKNEFEGSRQERLPFIIIIIDELADLMMVASKDIEGYITRIAQKARAVGIHLVLATQRPSVDIITGVIKANFPARIAFQVAQKIDSRTIIDQNGAEKLLGKGDLLYQSPMSSIPVRIQGGYISIEEIESIVHHCGKLGKPEYLDFDEYAGEMTEDNEEEGDNDELFVEALKIVEETKKASASYLQRRLSIGYNRAARIIEQMEDMGYIGPQKGSKPREVFV